MALRNYISEVEKAANKYPEAWRNAHTHNANTDDFIKLLAADLNAIDPNVGLNGKRGNPDDISDDALAVFDPGGDVVDRTGQRIFIVDVIAGAGGPNPKPAWQSVGGPSPGAWVKPERPREPGSGPTPGQGGTTNQPPQRSKPQYPGDQTFNALGEQLEADYRAAGQSLNAGSATWFARVIWDHVNEGMTMEQSIAKHRAEWKSALGIR